METILITGVTSSIGEALAISLSSKYKLILSGRNLNALLILRGKLNGEGHSIWACDFTKDDVSDSFISFLMDSKINPNHFLHVGGDFSILPIRLQKKENILKSFQANLFSAIEIISVLSKKSYRDDLKNILFFSSISAKRGKAGFSVYSAAKSSLLGLSKSLAVELSPVKVNCFVLGPIITMATESLLKLKEDSLNSHLPLGLANSSILNDWTLFLLENNNWMTGQEIVIDGGATVL
jgi:NAD(P)-dependent dehydrogenase (short-subunit alcohol dehydrogenase family)